MYMCVLRLHTIFIWKKVPRLLMMLLSLVFVLQMKIRLKYRFSFVRNGQEVVEMGDVSNFPY